MAVANEFPLPADAAAAASATGTGFSGLEGCRFFTEHTKTVVAID